MKNSQPTARLAPNSGAAMDTPLPPRAVPWALLGGAGAAVAGLAVLLLRAGAPLTQSVSAERLTVSTVTEGLFEDFIPLRGVAAPLRSVFLDAVEGGRVEQKLVEDGALVEQGQTLAVLSNSQLQLEVIRSESEVTNQLNTLRGLEIQLTRNRFDNERSLNEIAWQLHRIRTKAARDAKLNAGGAESTAAVEDSQAEERYWAARLDITRRGLAMDEQLQRAQRAQLVIASRKLEANLALARGNLEALTVKAPIAGRLTAFDLTVGQSLSRGQRLGQLDSPEASKLAVSIDEYHLNRVSVGQAASLSWEGQEFTMAVRAVNPQVRNGQFGAELAFVGAQPGALRRGQALNAKLSLGESRRALLLPAGPFLAEANGFVFVLEGAAATRRAVQLGRRNASQVEVLSGLAEGERVLTSSYVGLTDKEQLSLSR